MAHAAPRSARRLHCPRRVGLAVISIDGRSELGHVWPPWGTVLQPPSPEQQGGGPRSLCTPPRGPGSKTAADPFPSDKRLGVVNSPPTHLRPGLKGLWVDPVKDSP